MKLVVRTRNTSYCPRPPGGESSSLSRSAGNRWAEKRAFNTNRTNMQPQYYMSIQIIHLLRGRRTGLVNRRRAGEFQRDVTAVVVVPELAATVLEHEALKGCF